MFSGLGGPQVRCAECEQRAIGLRDWFPDRRCNLGAPMLLIAAFTAAGPVGYATMSGFAGGCEWLSQTLSQPRRLQTQSKNATEICFVIGWVLGDDFAVAKCGDFCLLSDNLNPESFWSKMTFS